MIKKRKILIVIADYYSVISNSLLDSAKKTLIKPFKLRVITVPGVFEIPVIISKNIKKFDAFIALGCVIKGETPHFDYIAGESAKGIAEISRSSNIPIIKGILTTDNARQAEDRSQVGGRNKGWDAMEAALQTINVYQEIFSASKC